MWIHLRLGAGLLLVVAAGCGAPALGQSSMAADRADSGLILRPADGERVPPFQDGRTMLLKIGPSLTSLKKDVGLCAVCGVAAADERSVGQR